MKRNLTSLLLIALIQAGLIAAVYWPTADSITTPPEAMVPLLPAEIDEIYVGDEFDNETVLKRTGSHWSLPELENLPADKAMVDKLLEAITTGQGRWPVAHSLASRQRFRVADYHYRRRISLLANGDPAATLVLGTSPGFRKIYARNEEQDAIYSIPISAHEAPGHSGAWLDKKLLQIRTAVRINADIYSLQRDASGNWLSGIGKAPDERELAALLSSLRSLQIEGLASADIQRYLAEAEADLVLNVESLAGNATLELFHIDEKHYIHSSEYPLFFTLGAFDFDRLSGIDFRLISGLEESLQMQHQEMDASER